MAQLHPYTPDLFAQMHDPRSRYIGASFVPALLLPAEIRPAFMPAPYARALAILGKRDLPEPDSMEVVRGKDLEPATINQLQRHGFEARHLNHYCQRADQPYFIASPDFELADGRLGEGKVPVQWEAWINGPPLHVQLQALWQMYCGETSNHLISALFVDQYSIELKWWPLARRDDVIRLLVDAATRFLDLIDAGKTPDPDASASSYRALQAVMPVDPTEQITLTGLEAVERLLAWKQAKLDRLAAERTEEASKYWFASRIGSAGIVSTDGGELFRSKVEPKGKEPYFKWNLPR